MRDLLAMIDKRVCVGSAAVCIVFIVWAMTSPVRAGAVLNAVLSVLTTNFGWLYLGAVFFFIGFLIWIALGKSGTIKLGHDDDHPEYKTSSWFFMLFAAGMGIGLVYWSVSEPMSMYLNPPLREGRTVAAAKEALAYTFLHWGVHPWACYAVVGLILAYFQHRLGRPALFSSCFAPLWGEKNSWRAPGAIVDALAVIATVFGVSTSLGMGAMQINSGLHAVFGIPVSTGVSIIVIAVTTLLFVTSAAAGLKKGMKRLSNLNMVLVAILIAVVFLAGATVFVLNYLMESTGIYLNGFIYASLWADAFGEAPGWLGAWTVFYWAWWISWTPFVGGFIARISRGRTIREFVFGVLVFPALFSMFFIAVLGGNAIHLDLAGSTAVAEALAIDPSYSLFALLQQFPLAGVLSVVALVLIVIFFVTSADSATGVCAQMTTGGRNETSALVKVFWGLIMALVSAILLVSGGLSALQTASVIVAFPFMFVIFGMIASFVRALSDDTIAPVEWIFDENPADDVHAVLRLPGAASGSGGNP